MKKKGFVLMTELMFSVLLSAQSDVFSAQDVTMLSGELDLMEVSLKNSSNSYTAFQFDVEVPEGIEFATDENGNYLATLSDLRSNNHDIYVGKMGTNNYRFLSYSMANDDFRDSDGILLSVTLKTDENMATGINTVYLKDALLVTNSGKDFSMESVPITVYVTYVGDLPIKKEVTGDNAGNWTTYYNGTGSNLQADENTIVYEAKINDGKVILTEVSSRIINDGAAVILKSVDTGLISMNITSSSAIYIDNQLQGSNSDVVQDGVSSYYGFADKTNGLGFYIINTTVNIPARKAFLKVSDAETHDFYGLGTDSGTTRIDHIKDTPERIYYNLSGHRVMNTNKGIFIVNGKKVLIK